MSEETTPKLNDPFDTIESAHEFMSILSQAASDARCDLASDIQRELSSDAHRRLDALHIALYKVEQLESHLNRSSRILNDLRILRRLLFEERGAFVPSSPEKRNVEQHESTVWDSTSVFNTELPKTA